MLLRQTGFTYSACGLFTKNKERIQKFKEIGYSRYVYQNELDKACFQHDMVYGDFKDLTRRTASDNILCDKAFTLLKIPKYDGYQRALASVAYQFIDKTSALLARSETLATRDKSVSSRAIKNENMSSKELVKELHKPIIIKFKKRKVHSGTIFGVLILLISN